MKLGDPKINYKANSLIRDFTFYKANVGAPKLFDRFKWEFEVKITEEQRLGACSLAHNISGVEGCVRALGWD